MLTTVARRIMSSLPEKGRSLIAVCQLTSDHDIEKNFAICKDMIERASSQRCKMIFFPECFDSIGRNREETINLAIEEESPFIRRFRSLAKQHGIWMSLGGFHNKVSMLFATQLL
ncbi:unnamed protein product [Haemonchus placei]|uniref:CN hydrolase domain-containing protein n=1 Tax=Haemonchus placei TaxID=6290 RepID=A0A0N4WKF3_HAEPC|nr:unnamed protein product [Haemonchus placei]